MKRLRPHVGMHIQEAIEGLKTSPEAFAAHLDFPLDTLKKVINDKESLSPELAAKLQAAGLGDAHVWFRIQAAHLASVAERINVKNIKTLKAA
jgi:addiction module HigA family antidote